MLDRWLTAASDIIASLNPPATSSHPAPGKLLLLVDTPGHSTGPSVIQAATIMGRAGCSGVVYRLPAQGDHDLEAIRVDLAEVVSEYIGETKKNLVRVFDSVEGTDEVLLFDEADGLIGHRLTGTIRYDYGFGDDNPPCIRVEPRFQISSSVLDVCPRCPLCPVFFYEVANGGYGWEHKRPHYMARTFVRLWRTSRTGFGYLTFDSPTPTYSRFRGVPVPRLDSTCE